MQENLISTLQEPGFKMETSVIHMSSLPQDMKLPTRPSVTTTYWNCPTPEAGDTPENYNTYTDLVTYRPEEYHPHGVYTSESSFGQMLFQLPMNVMAEDSGHQSPCFDTSNIKSEYSSGYDEGIGSHPSSSNPSPVVPSPDHQNVEQFCNSPSYFPQVEASSTRDSGIDYAESHPSLVNQTEVLRTECLRCGTSFSNFWCQKGVGHFLCERCVQQEREAVIVPPQEVPIDSGTSRRKNKSVSKVSDRVCINCFTSTTPLWRRDENQQFLCNACALYKKLHKRSRPQSMNKGTIQTRNRKPKSQGSKYTKARPAKASPSAQSEMMESVHMNALDGLLELHPSTTSAAHIPVVVSTPEPVYSMYSAPQRTQKGVLPSMSNSMAAFYSFVSDRTYQPSYSYHNEISATCGN